MRFLSGYLREHDPSSEPPKVDLPTDTMYLQDKGSSKKGDHLGPIAQPVKHQGIPVIKIIRRRGRMNAARIAGVVAVEVRRMQ